MQRLIVNSRVGADGVLRVQVPLGAADADRYVRVTIEPADTAPVKLDDYSTWLRSVAGKWRGEFERPPQGAFEERDPPWPLSKTGRWFIF